MAPELVLGRLALGDVAREGAVVLLALERQVVDRDLHGKHRAVAGAMLRLDGERDPPLDLGPVLGPGLPGEVGVDVVHRHFQKLFPCITQKTATAA